MSQVIQCEQGSWSWHCCRAGVITASMFSEVRKRVGGLNDQQITFVERIRAGNARTEAAKAAGYSKAPTGEKIDRALKGEEVGDYSEAAKNYAFRLAVERISGFPLDEGGFDTYAMRRGHELEPEARALHEERIGTLIEHAGFVVSDCGRFGASADGLIDNDGGSEYKCLINPERIRAILFDGDISEFTDQVQGGLWLTGRDYWDFALYCPALAPAGRELEIHRLERDDEYIASLEADLSEFDLLVERYRGELMSKQQTAKAA